MVDMKWRIKRKDLLCESEVQVFALNLDGTEGASLGKRLRFNFWPDWGMEYLIEMRLRFVPLT